MFHKLTAEVLVNITFFLDLSSILQLSLTSKTFCHLIQDELVFRRLTERDFYVNTKQDQQESWVQFYKNLLDNNNNNKQPLETVDMETINSIPCCHLTDISDMVTEIKRVLYSSSFDTKTVCDLCLSNDASFLDMNPENHSKVCHACTKLLDYPILLELATCDLYCIHCQSEPYKLPKDHTIVKKIREYMQSDNNMDIRRKAEHHLYIQELRREDMTLMYYFIEKQWCRNWMSFRTREGSPLPSKISNHKLTKSNGILNPNIRLPMDKYRPSPETHADIISEKLWSYLSKAYGVQGKAYNENDILSPEYARLRLNVNDFKNSIHLYP